MAKASLSPIFGEPQQEYYDQNGNYYPNGVPSNSIHFVPNQSSTTTVPYINTPVGSQIGSVGSQIPFNPTISKECPRCKEWFSGTDQQALDMLLEHHQNMHVIEDLSKTLVESMFEMVDRMNMILDRLDRRTRDE